MMQSRKKKYNVGTQAEEERASFWCETLQVCLTSQLGLYAASVKVFALGLWIALFFCFALFCFQGQWLQSWVGKYQKGEKECKEGEKTHHGKDREQWRQAETKIPVSKISRKKKRIPIPSQLKAWWVLAPWRSQPAPKISIWDAMWCEQVCVRTAGKCYILEDDILMQQKSTRFFHWF